VTADSFVDRVGNSSETPWLEADAAAAPAAKKEKGTGVFAGMFGDGEVAGGWPDVSRHVIDRLPFGSRNHGSEYVGRCGR
jgi:hypothetical protein